MKIKPNNINYPEIGDTYLSECHHINKIKIIGENEYNWYVQFDMNHTEKYNSNMKKERLLEMIKSKEIVLAKSSKRYENISQKSS